MNPLIVKTNYMFKSFHTLNNYVRHQMLRNAVDISFSQIKIDVIIIDLTRVLNISDYKIYQFGSRASGLSSPSSDCDFFIDSGDLYLKYQTKQKQADLVKKVCEILKKYPDVFDKLESITGARVPIIRFKHVQTGMDCDISFRNGLAVENTHLIKRYLAMDERVLWVVTAVKGWAKENNLVGRGKFSSYALVWMTLYILMLTKVVPPVDQLKKYYEGPEKSIAGWKCGFCQDKTTIFLEHANISSQELLQLFFYYFCDPEIYLKRFVVIPLIGDRITKSKFKTLTLPPEYESYVQKVQTENGKKESFNLKSKLCVQDPIELSHNLTSYIDADTLKEFQMSCAVSADRLDKIMGESMNAWMLYMYVPNLF